MCDACNAVAIALFAAGAAVDIRFALAGFVVLVIGLILEEGDTNG